MYHNIMTIKHSLRFSNILVILTSLGLLVITILIVMFLVYGMRLLGREIGRIFGNGVIWFLILALFIIIVSIINSIFTRSMTKRIVKPLIPLNEGVRQIQNNNFAYRINYQNEDEFRPICEAFDEMAAKLEASTEQREKDEANRRELIAGISHDLRTPLTSIIGCIEGIETGVASTLEKQKQYYSFIKNEAVHMKHIIEQLFLFSKLDMDEFPLDLHDIDIALAVSEMIEDSLAEYESQGLTIHIAEMPKDTYISADVFTLRNVIFNVLENSVKYKTKGHAKMEISAEITDNYVCLRFADDGPGVKEDLLPKLFDVFYRTDPSRSKAGTGGETSLANARSSGGSGLGLAISAKIIQRMREIYTRNYPRKADLPLLSGCLYFGEGQNNGR